MDFLSAPDLRDGQREFPVPTLEPIVQLAEGIEWEQEEPHDDERDEGRINHADDQHLVRKPSLECATGGVAAREGQQLRRDDPDDEPLPYGESSEVPVDPARLSGRSFRRETYARAWNGPFPAHQTPAAHDSRSRAASPGSTRPSYRELRHHVVSYLAILDKNYIHCVRFRVLSSGGWREESTPERESTGLHGGRINTRVLSN